MRSNSRSLLSAVLGMALMFTASSCTVRFGEDPVESATMGMGGKCLSGGALVIAEYYQGRSDEKKITGLWDCASRSLQLFSDRTRGARPGIYTSQELKIFLEEHFLDEYEITPAMMDELMALKRTLLGGDGDTLTAEEVNAARRLMEVLREQSLKLRPYLPLTFANYANADEAKVAGAQKAVTEFVLEISKVLTGTGTDYEFSRIDTLMREFEGLSTSTSAQEAFHAVRDNLPMLQQLKAALISPDPTVIASRDWEPLLRSTAKWFGLFLRTARVMGQNPSIIAGDGRRQILGIVYDAIGYLEESIERRPEKVITIQEFQNVMQKLDGGFLIFGKNRVKREHLVEFMGPLFTRLLGKPGSAGLNREGVARAREMIGLWADGQNFIDRAFERLGEQPSMGSSVTFKRSELLEVDVEDALGGTSSGISDRARRSAERVRQVISTTPPFYANSETSTPAEINLAPVSEDPEYSYRALTLLHLMDLAAEIFMDVYSTSEADKDDAALGVSEEEFKHFFADIQQIAGDLRIVDPTNSKSFLKRFAEANLFLAASNGDGYMNREETAVMLSYAISAKSAGGRVHMMIANVCNRDEPRPIPVDAFGNETIEGDCFQREFYQNVENIWGRIPGLLAYYKSLDSARKAKFEENFGLVARSVQNRRYTTPDTEGFLGFSQYLESFFNRFDRNRDGTIDKYEALSPHNGDLSAFQVFRQTLKKATCSIGSCVESDFVLENVFTYLLAHGKPPTKGALVAWIANPFKRFNADRGDITAVLANLSRAASDKSVTNRIKATRSRD